MVIEVIWTQDARDDYWENIEYLESAFTLTEVQKFTDKVNQVIGFLKIGNVSFKKISIS